MAREKINISIDADLLKDIDRFTQKEERPSRSNTIEVLVRRGFKLPLAVATLDFTKEALSSVSNPEADIVSFGNFLLKKHGVDDGVGDWDLDRWRNEG